MEKVTLARDRRNKGKPWVVRWHGEIDNDGRQRRYCKSFGRKAEAVKFQAKQQAAFGSGSRRDRPDPVTLGQFAEKWLRQRQEQIRPASYESYSMTIQRLKDHFGESCKLASITPMTASSFVAGLKPRTHKERLSPWSIAKELRNAKVVFEAARRWELIGRNPFADIRPPKLPETSWYYLPANEYHRLQAATKDIRRKALYALAYTCGLRLGEATNLTWRDVDFARARITIQGRGGTDTMPPFSVKDADWRTVPVPADTLGLLVRLHERADEGVPYVLLTRDRYDLVVEAWQKCRKEGKAWRSFKMANNQLKMFRKDVKAAKIEPTSRLSLHDLRKACGQNWADRLPIGCVKAFMGHSNIGTTEKFYNQVTADHYNRAAEAMDELLKVSDV